MNLKSIKAAAKTLEALSARMPASPEIANAASTLRHLVLFVEAVSSGPSLPERAVHSPAATVAGAF